MHEDQQHKYLLKINDITVLIVHILDVIMIIYDLNEQVMENVRMLGLTQLPRSVIADEDMLDLLDTIRMENFWFVSIDTYIFE